MKRKILYLVLVFGTLFTSCSEEKKKETNIEQPDTIPILKVDGKFWDDGFDTFEHFQMGVSFDTIQCKNSIVTLTGKVSYSSNMRSIEEVKEEASNAKCYAIAKNDEPLDSHKVADNIIQSFDYLNPVLNEKFNFNLELNLSDYDPKNNDNFEVNFIAPFMLVLNFDYIETLWWMDTLLVLIYLIENYI